MSKQKKITTYVNFILDKSGSMETIKKETISGFNEYINGLKKQKESNFKFTLTLFDSNSIETPYIALPIQSVPKLNNETYQPCAMTPLYDAVVEIVEKIAKQVKENEASLVVIMTDGQENASTKHDQKCLSDLIHKLEHKGNWTFVFMGQNQDAWANASQMGFSMGNVYQMSGGGGGASSAFKDLSRGTQCYAMAMNTNSVKGLALSVADFDDMMKGGDNNDSRS